MAKKSPKLNKQLRNQSSAPITHQKNSTTKPSSSTNTQAKSENVTYGPLVKALAHCVAPNNEKQRLALYPIVHELMSIRTSQKEVLYDSTSYSRFDQYVRTIIAEFQNRINTVLGRSESNAELCLVYGGATKIKGYVFESSEISEIRGASAILDWINSKSPDTFIKQHKLPRECLLYGSGGNIVAFAPVSLGEKFAQHIERTYTQDTLTAQSLAVSVDIRLVELVFGRTPDAFTKDDIENIIQTGNPIIQNLLQQSFAIPLMDPLTGFREQFQEIKGFGELITVAASKAIARRDGEHSDVNIRPLEHEELTPWTMKCHTSDIRPATTLDASEMISLSTERKRMVGRFVKGISNTTTTSDGWKCPVIKSWDAKYSDFLSHSGKDSRNIKPANSFEQIAEACQTKTKTIGIIYADGNNLGQRYASMTTPMEYKKFSDLLTRETQNIVFKALQKNIITSNHIQPFEIIAIGGDDCFIVVPGDVALQIALDIGQAFNDIEQRQQYSTVEHRFGISETKQPNLSLSAGVVIANHKTPFFLLERLVNDLLKNAKKSARISQTGTIDFISLVSLGAISDSVETIRQAYTYSDGTRTTARPYTWEELAFLLSRVKEINIQLANENFSSHLYRFANVIHTQGRMASDLELQATVFSKSQNESVKSITRAAKYLSPQQLNDNHDPDELSLWYQDQDHFDTILIDMMEIYDIIRI